MFVYGFAVSQINDRHVFLARFIGTQEREDISYNKANKVNQWATLTTCLCCILEIALYFAYNEMVTRKGCCPRTRKGQRFMSKEAVNGNISSYWVWKSL